MPDKRLFGESFDPVKFKRATKRTLDHYAVEAITTIKENVADNFWPLNEAPKGKRPADNFALGYKQDTGEVIKNFHDESEARQWLKLMGSGYAILAPRKKMKESEDLREAPEGQRPADQWVLAYKENTGEFVKVFHDEATARKWLAKRDGYAILTYSDWISSQPYVAASGMKESKSLNEAYTGPRYTVVNRGNNLIITNKATRESVTLRGKDVDQLLDHLMDFEFDNITQSEMEDIIDDIYKLHLDAQDRQGRLFRSGR